MAIIVSNFNQTSGAKRTCLLALVFLSPWSLAQTLEDQTIDNQPLAVKAKTIIEDANSASEEQLCANARNLETKTKTQKEIEKNCPSLKQEDSVESEVFSETVDSDEENQSKRVIYKKAIVVANWIDKFFGADQELESASYDYLRLINNFVFREGEEPKFRPRIKAKVHLPQLSNRTSLLFSNDKAADSKDFATNEIERSGIDNIDNKDLSAALNYQVKKGLKYKLDFRLGLDSSLDVFAFARYGSQLYENETFDLENLNYFFWEEKKGYGIATEFEMNKILDDRNLFRWKYSILRAEKSRGNEWKNKITLVNQLDEQQWITYDFSVKGASELDFDVETYRFSVRYRRKTSVDWLFLEVEPEVKFMRNQRYPERELAPGIAIRLEVQFE